MTKEDILNEPVGQRIKDGYMACTRCWRYFHHPLVYCSGCGNKVTRIKNMKWGTFLAMTARCGAGPINTIRSILASGLMGKLPKKYEEVWKEANTIYTRRGGWRGYTSRSGLMTETTDINDVKIRPTHWKCLECGYRQDHDKESKYGMKCPKCKDYLHPEGEEI